MGLHLIFFYFMHLQHNQITSARSSSSSALENPSKILGGGIRDPMDDLTMVTSRCVQILRGIVPCLLVDYLFPAAFRLLDDLSMGTRRRMVNRFLPSFYSTVARKKGLSHLDGNLMAKSGLGLQPPPKRLNGKARNEAFMLLQFLCRIDVAALEVVGFCLH